MTALSSVPGRTTPVTQGSPAGDGPHHARADQTPTDARRSTVGAGPTNERRAKLVPEPLGDSPAAHQPPSVATGLPAPIDDTRRSGPLLLDATLLMAATVVDDLERTRIANENRLRQLTRAETDSDGEDRGFGLTLDHPDVARLSRIVDTLADLEHQAVLGLQRAMRAHALGPWVKSTKGVGEKQAARLLAAIGDPYWNTLHDRPRTVSELWAYCGLHTLPAGHTRTDDLTHPAGGDTNVAARRAKGQRANWSTEAKTRAYLVAVSCMKAPGSPHRAIYLARRKHTSVTHPDWTDGHSHNDALRVTSKAILRDLWIAARDHHTQESP